MKKVVFMLLMGLVTIWLCHGCSGKRHAAQRSTATGLQEGPLVPREFRAAWVATVANINWPSKRGLPVAEQQREALALLDFLKDHHFNAVIFQVRPQADALYESSLEPWSYYLTGEQGKAPDPYYDPLEFWTEAAHDRGLELHVWLNPYRAHHTAGGPVSGMSMVKKMPESVVRLTEGYWWFDPAKKSTQDHGLRVVMDIVKRYDIDGVHFDDYFYPYPSYNGGADFPDSDSWAAYQSAGGKLSRGDWRREQVNRFIERVYTSIKAEKKHVKFGLSPFGVWRPGYPSSIQGLDQYDQLYADARLWLNSGWVDYFTPQLYWPVNQIPQSFPVLLGWWQQENTHQRHLWPGMNVGRGGDEKNADELVNQIMITRGMLPQSSGAVHWSISGITRYAALADTLIKGPYKQQALVPASPWLGNRKPDRPGLDIRQEGGQAVIAWTHPREKEIFRWVLHYRYGDRWDYTVFNRAPRQTTLALTAPGKAGAKLNGVRLVAVDRLGNESEAALREIH